MKASTEDMYFQTYVYPDADKYVKENVGDFLNSEMKLAKFHMDDVTVGKGIFVENLVDEEQLPLFYYPVFINHRLEYVFRIFDDGSGKYTGAFGKNYVEEISAYSSKNSDDAGLWAVSNGYEIISVNGTYKIIAGSRFEKDVDEEALNSHFKKKESIVSSVNVSEGTMNFVKFPQTKAYWVSQITYPETQGKQQWCLGFVTTSAIRFMSGNTSLRTANMAAAYGLSSSQGFSWEQVANYCARYGVSFSGGYNGSISATNVYNEISGWNLVLGCYQASGLYHALLLHGIDGSKVRVWNPWYSSSEWITNITTYNASGYAWKMYGYGYYR